MGSAVLLRLCPLSASMRWDGMWGDDMVGFVGGWWLVTGEEEKVRWISDLWPRGPLTSSHPASSRTVSSCPASRCGRRSSREQLQRLPLKVGHVTLHVISVSLERDPILSWK